VTTAIAAPNRRELVAVLTQPLPAAIHGAPLLTVTLPCCRNTRVYPTAADIPAANVGPCPCGNWFIRYTEGDPS